MTLDYRRQWFDQFGETGRFQLFVAEEEGRVVAYAGTTPFRSKAAYDQTVETTIYCHPEEQGRRLGSTLYRHLFDAVAGEDIHLAIAGITLPNDASLALHQRFGFEPAGVMHDVGYKFGEYWDVGWFEKRMK